MANPAKHANPTKRGWLPYLSTSARASMPSSGLILLDSATEATMSTEQTSSEELPHGKSEALEYQCIAKDHLSRASLLTLPHGVVDTPIFMPVGTQGTVKGLTASELEEEPINAPIILANTYFINLRPGTDLLDEIGGLHKLEGWSRNLLTDSGGFQMVSLLDLAEFTEEGVHFQSPVDGTELLLTPEKSMAIQNSIGSDIMMALDDVVPVTCKDHARFELAAERSVRWIDRCIAAHTNTANQNLFGIIQGGTDPVLREYSLKHFMERDAKLPGYAIGGLSGGEDKADFWRTVKQCCDVLPPSKPRYVMGVGYPVDLVVCVCLGADMFDCVYPTRTGRFGTALVPTGTMNLRLAQFREDSRPVMQGCRCFVCRTYTRAYLHDTVSETLTGQLIAYHNVAYQLQLMRGLRQSIVEHRLEAFVRDFMAKQFPEGAPQWVRDAVEAAGMSLE
ncbi:tRNA-guanine(15) transglycosylase-like [Carpediemonas membranifera]|uniref:Queuine tRNA-ribosyltransferase catalytic subunit 1 n=1 Tax=Carpediemonas membranifera TaxID=201153 RepID=A0A8J6DZD8_9EUKA|nr:tRNA-guanine(15) transglycosylase-like [Carpediemonas membranifera]|eukprot:KAG9390578.1 tRNA-guanine(15) transglycosylase-like [Carpediemonas membranifera]